MSALRKADPELQEDVDEMILDYLTFSATDALLTHFRNSLHRLQKPSPDLSTNHKVVLADGFISIYGSLHPARISADLQFRIRLLQFVKAMMRWHSLVSSTFGANQDKSGRFSGHQEAESPASPFGTAQEHVKRRYRTSKASLLHILPSFMALSASQLALQGGDAQITEVWMHLAGDFMLHAAFEYATIFEPEQTVAREKAFQWGFDWNVDAEEGSDGFIINAMFFDGEAEGTNEKWMQIRKQYEAKLNPPLVTTFHENARLQFRNALLSSKFEERLLVFLQNLHRGFLLPVLSQAELAQAEGFGRGQATEFSDIISNSARSRTSGLRLGSWE